MSKVVTVLPNYENLLLELATVSEFRLQETVKKYALDGRVASVIRELNLVQMTRKGHYKWVGGEPSRKLAEQLRDMLMLKRAKYSKSRAELIEDIKEDQVNREDLIEAAAAAAELAVRLKKTDIGKFIREALKDYGVSNDKG